MAEQTAEFRFEMWAFEVLTVVVEGERSPLVNPESKRRITVIATNQQAAYGLASEALGAPATWAYEVISITDNRIPEEDA